MLTIRTFPEIGDVVKLPDDLTGEVEAIDFTKKTFTVKTDKGEREFDWATDLALDRGSAFRIVQHDHEEPGENRVVIIEHSKQLSVIEAMEAQQAAHALFN